MFNKGAFFINETLVSCVRIFCVTQSYRKTELHNFPLLRKLLRPLIKVLVQWPNQEQMKEYQVEGKRGATIIVQAFSTVPT